MHVAKARIQVILSKQFDRFMGRSFVFVFHSILFFSSLQHAEYNVAHNDTLMWKLHLHRILAHCGVQSILLAL